MKNLAMLLALFVVAMGLARSDPNIYGPGGVNLGPNGKLPPSEEELKQKQLLEQAREQIRLQQQQIQQLQKIQQQREMQLNQQNQRPLQIIQIQVDQTNENNTNNYDQIYFHRHRMPWRR